MCVIRPPLRNGRRIYFEGGEFILLHFAAGRVGSRRSNQRHQMNATEFHSLTAYYVAFDSNRVLRKVGKNAPGAVKIYGRTFSEAKMKFMLAR